VDSIVSAREYFDAREIDIETIAAQPMSLMGQLHALPHRGIAVRFATKDAYVRGAKQILAWLHGVTGLAAWRLLGNATGGLSASTRPAQ
jgi:hypothetical protein